MRALGTTPSEEILQEQESYVTKSIGSMNQTEVIWAIEGYAKSARRSYDQGSDPTPTLSRIKSMIERFRDAALADVNGTTKQPDVA
jgi:hypothetical protein